MPRVVYAAMLGLMIGCGGGPSASPSPSLPPPPVGSSATCVGQSANLDLARGQTGSFQVFCTNTGTTAWTSGTATEASLATCCPAGSNVNATFLTWGIPPMPSPSTSCARYAVQSQSSVSPGANGSFAFSVTVPAGTAAGTYTSSAILVNAGCAPIATQVLTMTVRVP